MSATKNKTQEQEIENYENFEDFLFEDYFEEEDIYTTDELAKEDLCPISSSQEGQRLFPKKRNILRSKYMPTGIFENKSILNVAYSYFVGNKEVWEPNYLYRHTPRGAQWCKGNRPKSKRKNNYNPRFEDPKYGSWREQVMQNAKYHCEKCGKTSATHCHHIKNYKQWPKLQLEPSNGVLFCKECHEKFHKKYGTYNNNEKQLKEFMDPEGDL